MSILKWAERRVKALTIWDIGALKVYCVLFGMILGAYLQTFVMEHLWWFLVSVLGLGGVLAYRWFLAEAP